MTTRISLLTCVPSLAIAICVAGCPQADERVGPPPPAGTSCSANADCPQEQICTDNVCRYQQTSAAGEVLASSAASQLERGDMEGATRTYDQAVDAFEAAKAPIPPSVLCGAAAATLKAADTPEARERAAQRADQCFRASAPGDPTRIEVLRALSQLRYEGLDPSLFDRAEPANRYFIKEPQRPTIDQIQIALDLEDSDERGFDGMAEGLRGEEASRAIADCFIEHWELKHERNVRASLMLKFESKLRDMGSYDVYPAEATVEGASGAAEGFEPCLAGSLSEILSDSGSGNVGRSLQWESPFEVAARLP